VRALLLAHVLLNLLPQRPTVRVPEHHAGCLFLQVEEVLLLADLAVIALFRFFELMQVGLECFLVSPGGAVDALQHGVVAVTAPVGARYAHEFEGLDEAGVRHMRTATEIDKLGLCVEAQVFVRRDRIDNLRLVVFALLFEKRHRFVAADQRAFDRYGLLGEFRHARFDLAKVLFGQRVDCCEVVVEAVVDHRADRDLSAGVELLDRLRHEVRAGVTNDLHAFIVFACDDRELGV